MFIFEGNRTWVEERLKALNRDAQVARACSEVGARLDGADSVLTLCAVDDLLHERVGFVASPLQPPAGYEDPVPPSARRPSALERVLGFRGAVKRAMTRGEPPPSQATYEREFSAKKERVAEEWARYHATPRYSDRNRARVETAVAERAIDGEGMLSALAQDPVRRAEYRRFCERMRQLSARVEGINEFGNRLFSAFSRLGYDQMLCFSSVDPDDVHEFVSPSFGEPLGADANAEREWLMEQLRTATARPSVLSSRSEEASRIAGRGSPYVSHGPASLLEAAEEWLRRWTPQSAVARPKRVRAPRAEAWSAELLAQKLEDEYSIEGDARAQLAQAASNVVDLLASVTAWHEEEAGDPGRAGRQVLFRSLEAAFHNCVSFDGGLPPRPALEQLIVEGTFDAQLLELPLRPRKRVPTKSAPRTSRPTKKRKGRSPRGSRSR